MMRIGIRCFNLLCRIGFPRKNLESLSTGAYTALPLTIISGIREICIFRTRKSGNITERHLESTQNLATKISYRCFTRKSSIQNKAAGAKYVFPVAEHHDGFQMYKSEISKYNAFDMGPKRDLLDELREAIEEENLMFCTSSHRAEHWFFMGHGK